MRTAWLLLPLAVAPALSEVLDERSAGVRAVIETGLWASWAATLVAVLVPRTRGLVLLRIGAPTAVAVAVWAGLDGAGTLESGLALGATGLVALLALAPETGSLFVNGSAYGDERRHLLRAPAALLVGPIPLAGAAVVAGACAGPLLLAARQWLAGGVALAVGWSIAALLVRSLHALAQRWLVFVPAGLVLKDHMAVADPTLFRRRIIESLAPAEAGTEGLDLTAGAPGLVLELRLRESVLIVRVRPGRTEPEPGRVSRLLVVPTRPGAVLAEAARRRLPVR